MPAMALSRVGVRVVESGPDGQDLPASAWERLEVLPDPRSPQGRIYPLACLIAIALCAFTAAGNDRLTAVGQWIRRASQQDLAWLRAPWDPIAGRYRAPDEKTIRVVLDRLGPRALALPGDRPDSRLEPLDLAGAVVTFDALHTVRANLDWLVTGRQARCIAMVKRNQPLLCAQVTALPWRQVPAGSITRETGHGRAETRTLKAAHVSHLDFPHARQAIKITRWRQETAAGKISRETVYAITSLDSARATAQDLARLVREQWSVEAHHHVRDVTFGEDAATSRAGSGPANLATIRAAIIAAIKDAGYLHIPEGRRDHTTPAETLRLHGFDWGRCGHSRNTPEPWGCLAPYLTHQRIPYGRWARWSMTTRAPGRWRARPRWCSPAARCQCRRHRHLAGDHRRVSLPRGSVTEDDPRVSRCKGEELIVDAGGHFARRADEL